MNGGCGLFRYQAKLEALYTALEERQKERLRSLKEGTGGTVAERVKQVSRTGGSCQRHRIKGITTSLCMICPPGCAEMHELP